MIKQFLLVGLGGALGSMLRYLCSIFIVQKNFPFTTLLVNVSGSFIIGVILAYCLKNESFANNWKLFLATGICGGFTTFSTFSAENLQLIENQKWALLCMYILSSVFLGILAVFLGFKTINLLTH